MLKRAWYCLAVPWAIFLIWLASDRGQAPSEFPQEIGIWVIALGPLAVPPVMSVLVRFIVSGSERHPRAVTY
jgi:hypothetical protein